jgi:DNA-binding CsgD family transcriptional regulator
MRESLKIKARPIQGDISLTEKGRRIANLLREHKANGGASQDFCLLF